MPKLIRETPAAAEWAEHFLATSARKAAFGRITSAVVWADDTGIDGKQLVPLDPAVLVEEINKSGMPLLGGHDPGFPTGRVLGAATFKSPDGRTFVAAVLGYYDGKHLSFRDLGVDETLTEASPSRLPTIPNGCWIDIVSDPREIEPDWIDDLVKTAPMPVKRAEASHNAAEFDTRTNKNRRRLPCAPLESVHYRDRFRSRQGDLCCAPGLAAPRIRKAC